jgi:hypothetical protein
MGYMAKLFKKGSRVLQCDWNDDKLRAAAVTNSDGSVSVCIVSWHDEPAEIELSLEHKTDKPMRRYNYSAENVPYNDFCDLQPYTDTVEVDAQTKIALQPKSVTFLTTDYNDRIPAKIKNIRVEGNKLLWDASNDSNHCYYRVFAGNSARFKPSYEKQIASTVDTQLSIEDSQLHYKVVSVDRWGNVGK